MSHLPYPAVHHCPNCHSDRTVQTHQVLRHVCLYCLNCTLSFEAIIESWSPSPSPNTAAAAPDPQSSDASIERVRGTWPPLKRAAARPLPVPTAVADRVH